MRNYIVLMIILAFSTNVFGTLFKPISIKKHIKEADGIIIGVVSSLEVHEGKGDKIVTQATLESEKWLGGRQETHLIDVFYPGGQLGDKVQVVEGAPKLQVGEKVVLFTREFNNKLWVSNLGLGKYSIKRMGKTNVIINQIFPTNAEISQIRLDTFIELSEKIKEKRFFTKLKDKYDLANEHSRSIAEVPRKTKRKRGRSIASLSGEEEIVSDEKIEAGWLVLFLGLMGISIGVIRKKIS